jgi:ZIP family zinc transporter
VNPSAQMIGLGLAAGLATAVGGVLALRLQARTELLQAFSKGAVIGVALLELLPEALRTAGKATAAPLILLYAGAAFVASLAFDQALSGVLGQGSGHRGHLGAGALTLHSLMDGLAIGLAFQASPAIGAVVAAAVIAHDLSDGINTVNLSLMGRAGARTARLWLAADAVAPMVGIAASQAIALPRVALSPLFAALAGVLTYIGAGKLKLARREAGSPAVGAVAMAIGFGFILAISRLLA